MNVPFVDRRKLTKTTFVASRDEKYMTSQRIGELLANKSKASIEAEIGYEIYDGETVTVLPSVGIFSQTSFNQHCIVTNYASSLRYQNALRKQ